MDQEELIYEEEEVIWAKIRGYPWWPAFISEIHPPEETGQLEFTVVFFGDNTNSRMDASKLRKFVENYVEFFNKAKTHKKLMMSIMMAEEKLKQNDQNIDIFEQLRSKTRAKKKGYRGPQKEQNLSADKAQKQKPAKEPEIFEENEESEQKKPLKEPVVTKRQQKPQKKQNLQKYQKQALQMEVQVDQKSKMDIEEDIVNDQSQDQSMETAQKHKQSMDILKLGESQLRKGKKVSSIIMREVKTVANIHQSKQEEQGTAQKQNKIIDTETPVLPTNRRKNRKEAPAVITQVSTKKEEQQSIQSKVLTTQIKEAEVAPKLTKIKTEPLASELNAIRQSKQGKDRPNDDLGEMKVEINRSKDMKRSLSSSQDYNNMHRPIVNVRKRGRPKKVQIIQSPDESYDEDQPSRAELPKKKKLIHKALPVKEAEKTRQLTIADQTVIIGVQKLLSNREGLIEFLLRSNITIDNVKEILDMDVSNILQEGTMTEPIIHLLELLRSALLCKYFPDDLKHKKKYQKLIKKKNIDIQHEVKEDPEPSNQSSEIRRKTLHKVRKFLAGIDESDAKMIEVSRRIEEYIFRADSSLSKRYCKIAFFVLSALKDKKETYQEIMFKLESKLYN